MAPWDLGGRAGALCRRSRRPSIGRSMSTAASSRATPRSVRERRPVYQFRRRSRATRELLLERELHEVEPVTVAG